MRKTKELAKAIYELAEKLNSGEISFMDVYETVNKRKLRIVDGEVHHHEDQEVLTALDTFAKALASAFLREQNEIIKNLAYTVGHGAASGIFGPTFFRDIKHKS